MFIFNYSTCIDPLLREVRAYVPGFAGMKKEDKVLDIGCGSGAQVFQYLKEEIDAIGVDINRNMLKLTKKGEKKYGFGKTFFEIADATDLPFENNYFDFASISLVLHELKKDIRDKSVSEMKRVVKKGGGLIFVDF